MSHRLADLACNPIQKGLGRLMLSALRKALKAMTSASSKSNRPAADGKLYRSQIRNPIGSARQMLTVHERN
jgi:hypothetical protein